MKSLEINKVLHDKILRWAICSKREINFVCLGKGNQILKVVRLRNPEKFGRYTASINNREFREVLRTYPELKVIACGHSHIGGPARPSKGDMPPTIAMGKIEIIACTKSRTLTAWRIQNNLKSTIKNGRVSLSIH